MTKRTITQAVTEAKEFIRRADIVLRDEFNLRYIEIGCGNRSSGALRRQSMELTQALSAMRGAKP